MKEIRLSRVRLPTGPQRYRCSNRSPTYIKVRNMVEQAKLEVSYSGNHSVDFHDDNSVRIDPYSLFLHAMKSPVTKKKYSRRLEMFFNFIKIPGENLEERCLTFVKNGKNNVSWVFTNILRFVLFYKERIDKKEI